MTHGWGSVLDNEKGGYMESGASTCFLVDAEAREPVNAMVRLTAIPVNIVKRPADPSTASAAPGVANEQCRAVSPSRDR
jgi:hypothetical protein